MWSKEWLFGVDEPFKFFAGIHVRGIWPMPLIPLLDILVELRWSEPELLPFYCPHQIVLLLNFSN